MKYLRPQSLAELGRMVSAEPEYTLLAGGTDLFPRYNAGKPFPPCLIDVKHIPDLHGIIERENEVELGGCVTMEQIKKSRLMQEKYEALHLSTKAFAAVQIRHRATVAGNICNASPAGDSLPALYLFGAKIILATRDGLKAVPIEQFITGPGRTILQKGEVIKSVVLPKTDCRSTFYKLGLREAMAISVLNFAVAYKVENRRFTELKITAGAVAPTIRFLDKYAKAVVADPKTISESIGLVDEEISPIDDLRATAGYRRRALKNVLQYTLQAILNFGF